MYQKLLALAAMAAVLCVVAGCGGGSKPEPLLISVAPESGAEAGGTTLTLTGINFTDGMTVTVGGVDAGPLTATEPFTCSCVTPAGTPGPVDVVITTENGTYVLPDAYTYNAAPTVTCAVPATNQTVLPGYPVEIAYADTDPDDVAMSSVFADRDGNLQTTGDQILIEENRPEQGGATQTLTWGTANVPDGTYWIVIRCNDGMNAPVSEAAIGRVTVQGSGWARQDGGASYEYARELAAFPDGSSVVVGYFYNSTVFGVGEPNETELTAYGNYDVFVARYEANGSLRWVRQAGGSDYDYAYDVAAFPDGSCVVSGEFRYGMTFGEDISLSSYGQDDLFLARYAADGTVTWVHHMGSSNWDDWARVDGYADGSFVVTGRLYNAPFYIDDETALPHLGNDYDLYVARFDAAGSLAWVRQGVSLSGNSYVYDICTFPDGDCVVAGRIYGEVTLSYGEDDTLTLNHPGDGYGLLLARYDAAGDLVWGRQDGGPDSRLYGEELAAYPDGSVAVGGYFYENCILGYDGPGAEPLIEVGDDCYFVARYSASGSYTWARVLSDGEIEALAVDAMGNCVVGGTLYSVALIGADGPDAELLIPYGSDDIFLAAFAPDGSLLGARNDGGPYSEYLYGLSLLPDGSILATGNFYAGTTTLGRGGPHETQFVAPSTESQIWVARFNPDGSL